MEDVGPEDSKNHPKTPRYHILYGPPAFLPIWPFHTTSSLSLHHGKWSDHSVIAEKTPAILNIMLDHPLLERIMCSVGSVNDNPTPQTSLTDENLGDNEAKELKLSSGLGHGQWYDRTLAELLGWPKERPIRWCASPRGWQTWIEREHVDVEWDSRGKAAGGSLTLVDEDHTMLAIYKPRCASWVDGGAETLMKKGRGDGRASLGIFMDRVSEEALEHMVLACVAIEEQIVMSQGCNGSYHGGWGS